MLKAVVLQACLSLVAVVTLAADDPNGGTADAGIPLKNPSLIDISVATSQKRAIAGNGIGVTGKITNQSSKPIYLQEADTVLTLPPELQDSQDVITWYAYFPTEPHGPKLNPVIAIQPQDSYDVAWVPRRLNKDPSAEQHHPTIVRDWWEHIKDEMAFLWFTPGDYTLVVHSKYYTDPKLTPPYRTFQREVVLPTEAPEFVILFGAAVGGLIAFIVFPNTRKTYLQMAIDSAKPIRSGLVNIVRVLFSLVIVMLLSAIVTILLSRVAQTQFPIKVTVNDLWGAIAIGFVSVYLGTQWLEKLLQPAGGIQLPGAPTVSSATPPTIAATNITTPVTLHGQHFGSAGVLSVDGEMQPAPTPWSDTSVTFTLPQTNPTTKKAWVKGEKASVIVRVQNANSNAIDIPIT